MDQLKDEGALSKTSSYDFHDKFLCQTRISRPSDISDMTSPVNDTNYGT